MNKRFAIIGVGGFVAPRHLKAIKETGNVLVAAMDIHDSVGIIDSYFPEADFFMEVERFERFLQKLKNEQNPIDYLVVCTPNYLHDFHVRMGFNAGADVICEKPLVINPWNIKALERAESKSGKRVYTIMQLRLHPILEKLRANCRPKHWKEPIKVRAKYHAPRGKWYQISWKGDESKSGGLLYNIGIHLFDLLRLVYGSYYKTTDISSEPNNIAGITWLDKARVEWDLAIDGEAEKSIWVGDNHFDFGDGFNDLHIKSYKRILNGEGFDIGDVKDSIEMVHRIRNELSSK